MSSNPVIYWELASHDAPQTVEFLKKVFNWDSEYDVRTTIHELPVAIVQLTAATARLPIALH